jgi:hypothetical protein
MLAAQLSFGCYLMKMTERREAFVAFNMRGLVQCIVIGCQVKAAG